MLGWIFERECIERLQDHCSTTDFNLESGTETLCKDLAAKLSLSSAFDQQTAVPFALEASTMNPPGGNPFTLIGAIPQGTVVYFDKWTDLVDKLVQHFSALDASPYAWTVPNLYSNPFFDFALVHKSDANERSLEITTFQVTIAMTHSFKAAIVQCIATGLKAKNFSISGDVVHHAVLNQDKPFKFGEPVAASPHTMTRRSQVSAVAGPQPQLRATVDSHLYKEDEGADVSDADFQSIAAQNMVNVVEGSVLVLKDSFCAKASYGLEEE